MKTTQLSEARLNELSRWTNTVYWPRWELVMYHCKVTVAESYALIEATSDPAIKARIREGIRYFSGE